MDFITFWLPPEVIREVYLKFLNPIMAIRARDMGPARRRHRSAIGVRDFYCFLARYFLVLLSEKGRLNKYSSELKVLMKACMGKGRYDEIYACCEWTLTQIGIMQTDFNNRAPPSGHSWRNICDR
jgi:hypothetical protein